jgi:hypothetical protein
LYLAAALLLADPATPPKAEPTALSQRGVQRGITTRVKLLGKNLTAATAVAASHEKLAVKLAAPPTAEQAEIEIAPAADLPRGRYSVWTVSPGGESAKLPIEVDDLPQSLEAEPNDSLATAQMLAAPAGLWGLLAAKGDVDHFRFQAKAGTTVVFELTAAAIGSKANAQLTLFDPAGRVVAGNNDFDTEADPLLAYTVPADGTYTVQVSDQTLAGSGEHFYRLSLGELPIVTAAYPLSVPANAESDIELCGYNLPAGASVRVKSGGAGEVDVPVDPARFRIRRPLKVLVGSLPETREAEPNDQPAQATPLAVPGTGVGRIAAGGKSADRDLFRFEARAGQPLVIETDAARRGSPIDTLIEVLDADGRPVERVWLQATRDSAVTFRGVDANGRDVRLLNWEEMRLNEYLYLGGEVGKLFRAPQGPDSAFVLYEGDGGKRACYFDTSATVHALDEPCYIVVPHPPGAKLAANGLPVFRLNYVNDDDGQRKLGSDSRIAFDPPVDGAYLVRVRDSRAFGSDRHAYRLSVRPARPDFGVSLGGANPTLGADSGKSFSVSVDRIDGFDGPVQVDIGGVLPEGISVTTPLVIEAGHREAKGTIYAAAGTPQPTEQNWSHTKVTATATIDGQSAVKEVNNLGKIGLAARPKLVVRLVPDGTAGEIVIRPGSRMPGWLKIERNGFDGLVNLDVNNLPHGVIVDDIGLNAVQILEGQTERKIFFHCADWVSDTTRPVHAVAKVEGDQASPAVVFRVEKN